MIPYGRQHITPEDIEAVIEVLQSDWLTQGPVIKRFEQSIAKKVGAAHAVAVNSATSALHIACLSLGLGPGDWLWTSVNTFVASANCGLYCGAQVDFVDIDPHTYNMSVAALSAKLEEANNQGKLPKIVIPVHFAGQPCDMEAICALSKQYGFKIIEDASHAIGGFYKGTPIGSCQYSDITVFSFHPVKIITTGEGGVATTNDASLSEKMRLYSSHGISRNPAEMSKPLDGPWYYEQLDLGYNFRMTDIQAALGLSQLNLLNHYIELRAEKAAFYNEAFLNTPIRFQSILENTRSAWHLYVIRVSEKQHLKTFEYLRSEKIGVNLHYIPVHLQPYYQKKGFKEGDFPEAEKYYREAISLPLFPMLTTEQQITIINRVHTALS